MSHLSEGFDEKRKAGEIRFRGVDNINNLQFPKIMIEEKIMQ